MKSRLLPGFALGMIALLCGCQSKQLVFTTYTKTGLSITAIGELPNNFMFGYKRFEGAIIPVDPTKATNGSPEMPSVFARIGITNHWWKGVHLSQEFSTGIAAEQVSETVNQ